MIVRLTAPITAGSCYGLFTMPVVCLECSEYSRGHAVIRKLVWKSRCAHLLFQPLLPVEDPFKPCTMMSSCHLSPPPAWLKPSFSGLRGRGRPTKPVPACRGSPADDSTGFRTASYSSSSVSVSSFDSTDSVGSSWWSPSLGAEDAASSLDVTLCIDWLHKLMVHVKLSNPWDAYTAGDLKAEVLARVRRLEASSGRDFGTRGAFALLNRRVILDDSTSLFAADVMLEPGCDGWMARLSIMTCDEKPMTMSDCSLPHSLANAPAEETMCTEDIDMPFSVPSDAADSKLLTTALRTLHATGDVVTSSLQYLKACIPTLPSLFSPHSSL
jgi:hypothetical protein